jgi:hypothetical protein
MRPLSPDEFADRLADYLATRITPWPDEEAMREAVHDTVRLIFTEARNDTLAVLGVTGAKA